MTDLTDLVQRLTRDHDITVTRLGQRIGTRRQKPLLALLAHAVASTNATSGNGGRAGRIEPRLGFDATASELYTAIRRRAHAWASDFGVPRHWTLATGTTIDWRDPADLLTAWHARARHTDPAPYTPTLWGWVNQIQDLVVDPPKRLPLDAPCPECGQRWTLDPDGIRVDALRVLIRDPATNSETICRHCGAHWAGLDGAEHLADLIERRMAS